MTRASDDLQKALSGLKAAACAELGAQAEAATRAVQDLADAIGAKIPPSEGSPSSFASALELARLAVELDLQGNAFYVASKKLDAVRAFLPASGDDSSAAPVTASEPEPAPAAIEASSTADAPEPAQDENTPTTAAEEAAPSEQATAEEKVVAVDSGSDESVAAESASGDTSPERESEQPAEAPAAQISPDEVAVASWQQLPEGPGFDELSTASKARVEDAAKSHGIETVHHHEAPAHLHENVATAEEAAPEPDSFAPEPRGASFDDIAAEAKARVEDVATDHGIETVQNRDAPAHLHDNAVIAQDNEPQGEASASEPESEGAPAYAPAADPSIEGVLQGGGADALGEAHARVEEIAEHLESAPADEASEPQAHAEHAETPAGIDADHSEAAQEPQPEPRPAAVETAMDEQPDGAQAVNAEAATADTVSARDVAEATHDLGSPAEAAASGPVQEYGARETPTEPRPVPVFEAATPSDEAAPAQHQEASPPQPTAHPQPVPVYEAAPPREAASAQQQEAAPEAGPGERQAKPQEQKTLFSLWLDMVFGKKK
ncbi:hypothetical protein KKP04_12360 [Rhodomicrobium sp. Az07]|uniref:hypothetical protein n=1 Tax=Rhodomicrobium sp. Az07 TaxID=2839034 RepID=UPI001BE5FFAA|nr:hypothetical protein [Rhodomicrobium sp. Az07]MBT3071659.1 hypothetical protein [Rhodomicrobium sp. Az07]